MSISAIFLAVSLPVFDYATNSIAQRIAGADPAVALLRFADYPPSKGKLGFPRCLWEKPFLENEKFWLKGVDFSCASPWSDESGSVRAGTLISRRHVVFAKHFALWKGVRILFVDGADEVCPCRIEATKPLEKCDIMIGLLDYEVTPNIHPAKVLPEDYAKWIGDGKGLPIVTFNQRELAFLSECRGITSNIVCRSRTSGSNTSNRRALPHRPGPRENILQYILSAPHRPGPTRTYCNMFSQSSSPGFDENICNMFSRDRTMTFSQVSFDGCCIGYTFSFQPQNERN